MAGFVIGSATLNGCVYVGQVKLRAKRIRTNYQRHLQASLKMECRANYLHLFEQTTTLCDVCCILIFILIDIIPGENKSNRDIRAYFMSFAFGSWGTRNTLLSINGRWSQQTPPKKPLSMLIKILIFKLSLVRCEGG